MQATQVDIDMLFFAIAETSPSMLLWQWHIVAYFVVTGFWHVWQCSRGHGEGSG
jgi:hypothetical protein